MDGVVVVHMGTAGSKTWGGARVRRVKGFTGVDWIKNKKTKAYSFSSVVMADR